MPNYTIATLSADIALRDEAFGRSLNRIEGRLASTGRLLTSLSVTAAAVFAGRELIHGFEAVIGTAIDFEERLSQVRKTTGLAGESLIGLRDKLGTLASTFGGLKFGDLLDIAAIGGRLGIAGEKVADFARDIGFVTVALVDLPAEEAATSIAKILNVFKLGSESAINFGAALNKLDDISVASARDILDVTTRLSGAASVLGLAPQKVLALATALKDAGVSNEVAGTAFAQVFSKMATNAQGFAQVAGVSFQKFAQILKADPLVAIQLFQRGLKQLDATDQFAALDDLGLKGTRVKQSVLQLGQVLEKIPGYVRAASSEWKSLNTLLGENEVAGNTTKAQLERLKSGLQGVAVQIGDAALPIVRALANSFGELTANLDGFLKANKDRLESLGVAFSKAGRYVGLFISDFKTFVELGKQFGLEKFEQLRAILANVGTQLKDNLVTNAVSALQLVENVFGRLGDFLGDLFGQVGRNLSASLSNALTDFAGSFAGNPASRKIAELFDKFRPGTLQAFDDIADQQRNAARVPVPPIVPNVGLLGGMGNGVNFLNPFGGMAPFANLPDRQFELAAQQARLGNARAAADAQAQAQKQALLPKGEAPNPFAGRTPNQLRVERATRANQARKLRAEQSQLARDRARVVRDPAALKADRAAAEALPRPAGRPATLAELTAEGVPAAARQSLAGRSLINLAKQRELATQQQQIDAAGREYEQKRRTNRMPGAPRPANGEPQALNRAAGAVDATQQALAATQAALGQVGQRLAALEKRGQQLARQARGMAQVGRSQLAIGHQT